MYAALHLVMLLVSQCSSSDNATQYDTSFTADYVDTKVDTHLQWLYEGLTRTVLSELENVGGDPSEMKLIDIACGIGDDTRAMADRFGYAQIVGVDKSQSQLDTATKQSLAYPSLSFQRVDVGSEMSVDAVNALGGPFDVAVAMWLFNYAETKSELRAMIAWVNAVLKPGGALIAVVPSIAKVEDIHNGTAKDDARFFTRYIFGDKLGEGMFVHSFGPENVQDEHHIDFCTAMWAHTTYETLFDVSGFDDVRFLNGDDFRIRFDVAIDTDTEGEAECRMLGDIKRQAMMWEYQSWKGRITSVFTAHKKL